MTFVNVMHQVTLGLVITYTLYFLGGAGLRSIKQRSSKKEAEKIPSSLFGISLQLVAYGLPFVLFAFTCNDADACRPGALLPQAVALFGLGTGILAVTLSAWSVHHLGKQWSIVARLRQDHVLIQNGPYAIVRHPIYTARFLMLAAALLAVTNVAIMVPALIAFLIGTMIRIDKEEALLRARFGSEFDAYAYAVPAVLPRPWKRSQNRTARQVA